MKTFEEGFCAINLIYPAVVGNMFSFDFLPYLRLLREEEEEEEEEEE